MNEQTVDIPLLRKAVEWAEAEATKPSELCEWEQGFWIMPASADDPHLSGGMSDSYAENIRTSHGKAAECGTCFCIAGYVLAVEGQQVDWNGYGVDEAAGVILGISTEAGDALFASHNSIGDVRRIAEDIAGERL